MTRRTDLRLEQLRFEPGFTSRDGWMLVSGAFAATGLGIFIAWMQGAVL